MNPKEIQEIKDKAARGQQSDRRTKFLATRFMKNLNIETSQQP